MFKKRTEEGKKKVNEHIGAHGSLMGTFFYVEMKTIGK